VAAAWRAEPFRIFFPLGVLLAWVGIGHWLLYALGLTATYSCEFHGLVQTQAFLMAFAVGFLLTALPRRTQTTPPSALEMGALAALLVTITGAAMVERWGLVEIAYGLLFVLLLQFALRRFLNRDAGRRPPAAFVLIPLGVLHGVGGAALIIAATSAYVRPWTMGFGRLLVEQGVFLCFAVGIGSLVLPLIGGSPPPADLGSSPREGWKALAYGGAGVSIFVSLALEQLGWVHGGPLLRAAVVTLGLALGGGAWNAPGKPGLHRRLVWLAAWCMPLGLLVSGLWPDYRVPALHILFIGGFGLLAFAVATHVAFAHLNLEAHARGRPPAVAVLGISFLLALLARLAADISNSYFDHLGWAAALWLLGSAVWLTFLGPKLLRLPR
jgi:uncharacterized protein involved in response to NO